MSNHELTQIFYDGLGLQDRYLFDATSDGTFMSKFEDDTIELIKTVAENSHHNPSETIQKRCHAEGLADRRQISKDGHAPREG